VPDAAVLCEPEVSRVTAAAAFAHVAIETASGPHVTPVLFAESAGRIWFVVARSTLKARVLARRPRAAILLREDERSVMVRGDVRLLDPLRPMTWTQAPHALASAPFGLQSFAFRNPRELFGFALDTFEARGGPMAGGLLLAALEPAAVATVESDSRKQTTSTKGRISLPRGIPREVAQLPRSSREAVLGWIGSDGPIALPARWEPGTLSAVVAREAADFAQLNGAATACIAFDAADRRRPTGKRGVMLRGQGKARRRGKAIEVRLEIDRATWWIGFETGTTP
jgi:pyridoxamine 5'-phosphate oxidase-like protein